MRGGEITALLGANGAGKTTTISMLTGLVEPDAGDATIGGLSIRSEMEAIRGALGVCPQDNVLYDLLTAREHLELFTALRSGGGGGRAAVDSLLARASLAAKARKSWSSVAVNGWSLSSSGPRHPAGGARTLFLDEPTSGMDPHSRRAIWALLREVRRGRTVVLTTHFLDEAELLS
ncbi:hypothetical protein EMIHUDRAFT_431238 [Emiliania huxleyi CCMP1516]|uniref:AAA+ ATPase domain-containing protein n=2 Tax=Emiliania huxleyi TaxID=2903 RepID=A0A0D3IIX4_EMIH1|nr:hypothetical protein EMIHUDRAFT_431238 [Emiliania huxleyi CCMP1516]EOD11209.1 hypothetical protein EMIHUDRAFT_431238 [Emiliania huxleyi CCMP1516]|eukprot:XP_005763638.1 hypothetical protein EMIHUDRAFT_431238 [Emiliania huxleyi CCMP1516]